MDEERRSRIIQRMDVSVHILDSAALDATRGHAVLVLLSSLFLPAVVAREHKLLALYILLRVEHVVAVIKLAY